MMIKKFLIVVIVMIFAAALPHHDAFAQRCDFDANAIFKLRDPTIGAYSIWDSVHGTLEAREKYVSGVVLENGHVLALGQREMDKPKSIMLTLTEIDRRGRVVWEKTHMIKGLNKVIKILKRGENDFVVLAQQNNTKNAAKAWIGFFDRQGILKSRRVHAKAGGAFYPHDLIQRPNTKGFMFAVSVKNAASDMHHYSELYILNHKAQIVSKRSYITGLDNQILTVSPIKDGGYMASGYMRDASGRKTGWLLRVDANNALMWQRQYPRGAGAEFHTLADYQSGFVLAAGHAMPIVGRGKHNAGWVAAIDARNGDIGWQRYFTGNAQDYIARDMLVSADGLISVMIDSKIPEQKPAKHGIKHRDHVRLMTLNPRGVIFAGDELFNGEKADAFAMIRGPSRERILFGTSDVIYDIEQGAGENKTVMRKRSQEAWIIASSAMGAYNDPCKATPN